MSHKATLSTLSQLASSVNEQSAHWIGHYPGGNSGSVHCRTCCEQHVARLQAGQHPALGSGYRDQETPLNAEELEEVEENRPFVDGGWGSDHDQIPKCHTCYAPLTGSLSDTAIDEEISHYTDVCDQILIICPVGAWELMQLLDNLSADQQDLKDALLSKVTFPMEITLDRWRVRIGTDGTLLHVFLTHADGTPVDDFGTQPEHTTGTAYQFTTQAIAARWNTPNAARVTPKEHTLTVDEWQIRLVQDDEESLQVFIDTATPIQEICCQDNQPELRLCLKATHQESSSCQ